MRYIDFNEGWRFGFAQAEEWTNRTAGKATRPVTLPHDFRLELSRTPDSLGDASEAYYPGGVGFYEKTFTADAAMCAGHAMLAIDGAYRITAVRLNRDLLVTHTGGYTAFFADLTGKLLPGENRLLITVDGSLMPGSRWYPGAGLYRGVALLTGGQAVIEPWGLCLRTPTLDTLEVSARIKTSGQSACHLRYTAIDDQGQVLATVLAAPDATATLRIADSRPWHPDDPYLYTLRAELLMNETVLDTQETRFGLRTLAISVAKGLLLNGQPIKLKGGCVHHDNGILGAKSLPDAERRKVQRMKDCGYNAIRCAHNPPAASFLDACDALGMLVIDEAFDCWNEGKRQLDDHIFFAKHWESELEAMILRDRNHPSVIMWSTGNEIVERSGISDGAAWSERLAAKVRALDPTRPVNNAVCGFFEDPAIAEMAANSLSTAGAGMDYWAEHSQAFLKPLDVAGYNYLLNRYEKDHALFPERVFIGTESFPMEALDNWQAVERLPYLLGDFVWTSWDYLGESGIGHSSFEGATSGRLSFPFHLANCGDLDICGDKRPQSHFRDFVWAGRTKPYIGVRHPKHALREENLSAWGWADISACWNWPGWEEKPTRVTVYADGDEVELLLNDESMGRLPCGEAHRYTAFFTVPYQAGILRAVTYRAGEILDEACLETTGMPAAWQLVPESDPALVPLGGLLYVAIEAVDVNGQRVPDANGALRVAVEGGYTLFALGNAEPQHLDNYTADSSHVYLGRAMAVLRRTGEGSGRITVCGEALAEAVLTL